MKVSKKDQTNNKRKINKKTIMKLGIFLVAAAIIVFGANFAVTKVKGLFQQDKKETVIQTADIETRDIKTVLSSSGTIEPLNEYQVTSLTQGEVISAPFEEGDEVKKGDVLYQIGTDDVDNTIKQAQTQVERAEDTYNETAGQLNDLTVKAKVSGTVKKLYVSVGDNIQNGAQIADIYDNSVMLLEIPFNSASVTSSWVGKAAEAELQNSSEVLKGTVTKVDAIEQVLSGNRVVKMVTISVKNPGGITNETLALASVGSVECAGTGTFTPKEETTITAKTSGEISSVKIKEGQTINSGEIILVLDSNSIDKQLKSNKQAIEDAKDNLKDKQDSLSNYQITAPISGMVITKNTKEGDTIANGNNAASLAVIYDLSALKFDMYIDELDIKSIAVGQTVNITADALEGAKITGKITNISLVSTASGGVTEYPVTVLIEEAGELLPGMNVTGEIITAEAKQVISVPVEALIRGNKVYVEDSTVKEAQGNVPAGFKETEVETGLNDGSYVEIKSGLTGLEKVYIAARTVSEDENSQMMMPMNGGENFNGNSGMPPSGGNNSGNFKGGGNRSGRSGS